MPLEAIVLLVAGLWVGVLFLATFLCKAAKLGDEALEDAHRCVAAATSSRSSRSSRSIRSSAGSARVSRSATRRPPRDRRW